MGIYLGRHFSAMHVDSSYMLTYGNPDESTKELDAVMVATMSQPHAASMACRTCQPIRDHFYLTTQTRASQSDIVFVLRHKRGLHRVCIYYNRLAKTRALHGS
jgi:hypothetical protein